MRLRDLATKSVYRTDEDNILADFYMPALRLAVSYDRAVGFFSASMLCYAGQGLAALTRNGGRMRLIIGAELAEDETDAIARGYDLRRIIDRLGEDFERMMDRVSDDLFQKRIELLAMLVASGRLDIKVAARARGMYHEKIGIITDKHGDRLVFQGSANETVYALIPGYNFESINVFSSWRPELRDHSQPHIDAFERLWENRARDTTVLPFPEAIRARLVKIAAKARLPTEEQELALWREAQDAARGGTTTKTLGLAIPTSWEGGKFETREHQRDALQKWQRHDFKGILALATGAGKTVTALYGATRVFESYKRLALVIVVPFQNLADQWVAELRKFGVNSHQCYASTAKWLPKFSVAVSHYQAGATSFLCAVAVNRTFGEEDFQRLLGRIPGEHLMFVGDECHHLASPTFQAVLPAHARLRLGLSATPDHYADHEANRRLHDYFGETVAEFTLQMALDAGILTPYTYQAVPVPLEEDEAQQYEAISLELARLLGASTEEPDEARGADVMKVLLKRSRLLAGAKNKVVALERLLRGREPISHTLFYCGDGSVTDDTDGEDRRHVDIVSGVLRRLGWSPARFTAEESRQERERILSDFRLGLVDGLVAIRCLDEGIDVPACRAAYMIASGRNPRQFIQRRGRILRRAAGKKRAEIVDFVVVPPENVVEQRSFERKMLIGELGRVAEFARSAENPVEAVSALRGLLDRYELHHHLV
jgi:superfamily II DNA or RNA helicase